MHGYIPRIEVIPITVKEYLQHIEVLDMFIATKKRERKEVLQDATSIASALGKDGAGTGGVSDRVGNYVFKMCAIDDEIESLNKQREERINAIKSLDKPMEIKVLYKRYVEYNEHPTLSVIADEMGYTPQYITQIHGEALRKLKIPK
jgi:DNA-directed RNA polymerase sigma subunit (sigma70/sigma32)